MHTSSELFFDLSPCGQLILETNGRIKAVNATFCNLAGYSKSDLVGEQNFYDLVLKPVRIYLETQIFPLLLIQGSVDAVALDIQKSGDGAIPALINFSLEHDVEESESLILVSILDATDRRTFETELLSARKKAEQARKENQQLLYTLGHDIRDGISGIGLAMQMLQLPSTEENRQAYLSMIEASVNHLDQLTASILNASDIENSSSPKQVETFEVSPFLNSVTDRYQLRAREKGLSLRLIMSDGLPKSLVMDGIALDQILSNLVSNALKFTVNGSVEISAQISRPTNKEECLEISVSDTGKGINLDRINSIFSEYVQENAQIKDTYGGTGLGLAICKKLTMQLNGEIECTSVPGKGTCFTVHIPL